MALNSTDSVQYENLENCNDCENNNIIVLSLRARALECSDFS